MPTLLRFLREIFFPQPSDYRKELEQYISSRNPQSLYEVEFLERQFNAALFRRGYQ